jgi:hypothetical protein
MNTIVDYSAFEPSNVQFGKIRKNANGGQMVYLSWKDGSKVHLQLPFMRTPFGLSAFTDKKTQKVTYSLDLSFDNDDREAQVLLEKLNAFDDLMVKTVAANSTEWLGKPLKEEGLREVRPMFALRTRRCSHDFAHRCS